MHEKERRNLIRTRKQEIAQYIRDMLKADDLDLYEEAAAKLNDVLVVWQRAQADWSADGRPIPPKEFTFSDGITRNFDRMAFDAAYADAFSEWDGDEEWPAWMEREKDNE